MKVDVVPNRKAAMRTAAALGARRSISAEIEQLFDNNPERFVVTARNINPVTSTRSTLW